MAVFNCNKSSVKFYRPVHVQKIYITQAKGTEVIINDEVLIEKDWFKFHWNWFNEDEFNDLKLTDFELTYYFSPQVSLNYSNISDYREVSEFNPKFSLKMSYAF